MICVNCGRDIDAMGQDSCSHVTGEPLCEDCAQEMRAREWYPGDCDYCGIYRTDCAHID